MDSKLFCLFSLSIVTSSFSVASEVEESESLPSVSSAVEAVAGAASATEVAAEEALSTARAEVEKAKAEYEAMKADLEEQKKRLVANAQEELAELKSKLEAKAKSELDSMKEALASQMEAMKSAKSKLTDREEEIDQEASRLDQNRARLEALEKTLSDKADELANLEASLGQRTTELQKSLAALETERTNYLKKVGEAEAKVKAASVKAQKAMENPPALALDIFNTLLPEAELENLIQSIVAEMNAIVQQKELSQPIEMRVTELVEKAKAKLKSEFEYETLRRSLITSYLESFSPAELVAIRDFYKSEVGSRLLAQSEKLNANLAGTVRHMAESVLADFNASFDEVTSEAAIDSLIQKNLELIATAGESYLEAKRVREIAFPRLVTEGFLAPIEPVDGEVYTGLRVIETGGVLSVRTGDGRRVFVRY